MTPSTPRSRWRSSRRTHAALPTRCQARGGRLSRKGGEQSAPSRRDDRWQANKAFGCDAERACFSPRHAERRRRRSVGRERRKRGHAIEVLVRQPQRRQRQVRRPATFQTTRRSSAPSRLRPWVGVTRRARWAWRPRSWQGSRRWQGPRWRSCHRERHGGTRGTCKGQRWSAGELRRSAFTRGRASASTPP